MSNEKNLGWLFYIEDYTTQLYRDYNAMSEISDTEILIPYQKSQKSRSQEATQQPQHIPNISKCYLLLLFFGTLRSDGRPSRNARRLAALQAGDVEVW